MQRLVYRLTGITVIALLSGCATTTTAESASSATSASGGAGMPVAEQACFNARTATNFSALSRRHVYVQGRRNEHYLLTMFNVCFGLRNASGIAIENTLSRVCSNTGATIYYRDFGRLEACRVSEVESVASRQAAQEIVELREASR